MTMPSRKATRRSSTFCIEATASFISSACGTFARDVFRRLALGSCNLPRLSCCDFLEFLWFGCGGHEDRLRLTIRGSPCAVGPCL